MSISAVVLTSDQKYAEIVYGYESSTSIRAKIKDINIKPLSERNSLVPARLLVTVLDKDELEHKLMLQMPPTELESQFIPNKYVFIDVMNGEEDKVRSYKYIGV